MELKRNNQLQSEVGLSLRPPHYRYVQSNRPDVPFFEAVSENYLGLSSTQMGGIPLKHLTDIRSNYPILLHGVSLSIGSTDAFDWHYLNRLKRLIEVIEPADVSDHLCWSRHDGVYLHDLLPLPQNRDTLNYLVSRVQQVQEFLGRTISLENITRYIDLKDSEMEEAEFLNELAEQTGCGILIDVNNVFVNASNQGHSATAFLDQLKPEFVTQFHLSGHYRGNNVLIDTHDGATDTKVLKLFQYATQTLGDRPTVIEWDENIPKFEVLLAERKRIEQRRVLN